MQNKDQTKAELEKMKKAGEIIKEVCETHEKKETNFLELSNGNWYCKCCNKELDIVYVVVMVSADKEAIQENYVPWLNSVICPECDERIADRSDFK